MLRVVQNSEDHPLKDTHDNVKIHAQYKIAHMTKNPISNATYFGRLKIVRKLIDKGATYKDPSSALWRACYKGDLEAVRIIMKHGGIHADKASSLFTASCAGYDSIVRLLLTYGGNPNIKMTFIRPVHLLTFTSLEGHSSVVRILLEAGANVHANNDQALRWAASRGHTEVVRLLLAYGADQKESALCNACHDNHMETIRVLLEAGTDVYSCYNYIQEWASDPVMELLDMYYKDRWYNLSLLQKKIIYGVALFLT